MTVLRRAIALAIAIALPVGLQLPAAAGEESGQTLTIGVDHFDPANQEFDPTTHQPKPGGRLFSYTDFFTRTVTVHRGDTLNFQDAGGFHLIAVAANEAAARRHFPLATPDEEAALGTGGPRLLLGSVLLSQLGPPDPTACGFGANDPCSFTGSNMPFTGIAGFAAWSVKVNVAPGNYSYFCFIHPGMSGKLKVVRAGRRTTTQSQINDESWPQFVRDRNAALKAEAEAGKVTFTGEEPGSRTYLVHGGVTSPGNHVSVLEMLPAHLNLVQGDRVKFVVQTTEPHSFTFPTTNDGPGPFTPDCSPPDSFFHTNVGGPPTCGDDPSSPEFIIDPGDSPSGTALTNPKAMVDSGLILGAAFRAPGPNTWSVTTNTETVTTADNPYNYHCVLHDFMQGTLDVAAASSED